MQSGQKQKGFTIVELLIVIVVIAILAVITVVSFNGIQNRANDTAVQADLRNFTTNALTKLQTSAIASYPLGNDSDLTDVRFAFNTSAYDIESGAVLYCVSAARDVFVIYGRSKSGKQYYSTSKGQTGTTTTDFGSYGTLCSTFTDATTSTYARYAKASGTDAAWRSWTK